MLADVVNGADVGVIKSGGGTSFDQNYRRIDGMQGEFQEDLRVVGREGEPCYRCGTPIVKTVVGQRGTYFCPNEQKL